MKRYFWLALLAGLIFSLVLAAPALAGGWAVVTLDELPGRVSAGQAVKVQFTILQHGRTPFESPNATVKIQHADSGEQVMIEAKPEGEKGHYAAELAFSQPGRWHWQVSSGLYPEWQPMPDLQVLGSAAESLPVAGNFLSQAMLGSVAIALAGLVGSLWLSRRTRWGAIALALAALGAGSVFYALTANGLTASLASAAVSADSQVALGQDLFLAKGCVVCHVHAETPASSSFTLIGGAPALTNYHNDPEYLYNWLRAPEEVKPQTEMPNLNLSDEEIGALIAFINSDE